MTMLTKLFCVLIVFFCEIHWSYWCSRKWFQRYSFIVNFSEGTSHAEDEENDSNETPACDDDAHKAVLCTHSNFLWRTLVIQMLKKIVSKILCYSLLLFWRKWSCRGCKKRFQWYSCMRWQCSKIYSLFSHKLLLDIITKYICPPGMGPRFYTRLTRSLYFRPSRPPRTGFDSISYGSCLFLQKKTSYQLCDQYTRHHDHTQTLRSCRSHLSYLHIWIQALTDLIFVLWSLIRY